MQSPDYYEFFSQAKFLSGNKALDHIPVDLDGFDARKPLVLTSKKSVEAGVSKKLIKAFYESNTIIGAIYDEIPPYASIGLLRDLFRLFKDRGCDSLIALGGGSVMDVAKGLNIMVSENTEDLFPYAKDGMIHNHLKPLVGVLTAEAKGMEMSNRAVVDRHLFVSDFLFPDLVVLDASVTRWCCSECAVDTGITALVHALEGAYLNPAYNPVNDAYASTAVQFVLQSLSVLKKRPKNRKAGLALANATAVADIVFSNSPSGPLHLLATAMEKITGLPYAKSLGVMLPHFLGNISGKKGTVKEDLLLAAGGAELFSRTPADQREQKALGLLKDFRSDLQEFFPQSFKAANIPPYKLEEAAEEASRNKEGVTKKDGLALLEMAWNG